MKGRAFAPAHISGIFVIELRKNPLHSGSLGCGICLEHGAVTSVTPAQRTVVRLNGKEEEATTTLSVIEQMTDRPVLVDTVLDIPVGCGLGASGAGALSTAIALNSALSLDLTMNRLFEVAHTAEVSNRTGLGDVCSQSTGGVVMRKRVPCRADRIPVPDIEVSWLAFSPLSTKEVLEDASMRRRVNKAGRLALRELMKRPTIENFMVQSRKFAFELDLLSSKARDAIEAVWAGGGMASQSMLGDTVFAIDSGDALSGFGTAGKSRISHGGARLL